ncbi:MAG: hemerythrin domain-containing protein [Lacipirellulaceae bacterium]
MYATNALTTGAMARFEPDLQEQQILEHIKGALRVMVEWRAPSASRDRKQSSVRFALDSFCRHLERLMVFEERGGYLANIAEARPQWQWRLSRLRAEHARIRERVNRLAPSVADPTVWSDDRFEESCHAIRELLDEVDEHGREEIALLQDTLLYDEGGEG